MAAIANHERPAGRVQVTEMPGHRRHQRVPKQAVALLTALLVILPMVTPAAPITINLQRLAAYDAELPFQKAFSKCELNTAVPGHVASATTKTVGKVVLVDDASHVKQGLALDVRIAGLEAPEGGGWSGPKALTLEARLYRDGQLVESFLQSHRSKGHSVGLIKAGTCSILNSNAEVLAERLADWVKRKIWVLGLEN